MKRAIMTMGLPASGKTTTLDRNYDLSEFTVIDPDRIKEEREDYDPKHPEVYHEWSKAEAKFRTAQAIYKNEDIVIDGTGTNVEKMYKQIQELQAEGYTVNLVYVQVSLQTAVERNSKRERVVPQHIIIEKFETIQVSFEILSRIADVVTVLNND